MAYDDLLISIGQFGRYQKRIYLLLCLPAISCALHKLSGVFLQAKVAHRCRLPIDDNNSSYHILPYGSVENMLYPWDSGHDSWSSCELYDTNYTDSYFSSGSIATHTLPCTSWIYDSSIYETTTTSEWNLVCDRAWLRATSDALLMIGVMLGSIIFGDLSDRLGRKPIFFISLVLQVIFGVLVSISPDVYTFMLTRMIVGATTSGVFLVAYVIAMELVGPKRRMFAGVAFQLFFTAGFFVTAFCAYFIRNWRLLQLTLTLPGIAFFSYWWFIPESVRWLLTKGRTEEAKANLEKVAKENRKLLDKTMLDDVCAQSEAERKVAANGAGNVKTATLIDLFKYPNLRKKSLIIFFLWFVNSGTYYGLSWNTSNLGGNEYINFVISGAVEIPAYTILIFTLDKWGRKIILCGAMIFAGLCLIATAFVPSNMTSLNIVLAMAGKLAISSSYSTVYVVTGEQFPTVVRNVGLGAASTFARIGGILAPYVNIMAEVWTPLPLLIFGILALLSGTSALLLPETLNRKLPESIEDGETFGNCLPRKA
ncbi:hypothetical protein O3M35_008076 [Rhynocoris fuscipes]|uniref:Major facilitator superfamily (MFS) profile domain-containing protein n=1 Tax=Rhynocoris fuscipes TaxID=488301 RepID=A0AAW1D6A4_9HEMI